MAPVRAPAAPVRTLGSSVQPIFTCEAEYVCIFQNNNYTGDYKVFQESSYADECLSTTVGGAHAGSVNNNTKSILWVYDHEDDLIYCLPTGRYVLGHSYGYMYIDYGVANCPMIAPPC